MKLSTGMFVYRDLISRLAKDLFFILMSISLSKSEPKLLMRASVTVLNNGNNVLAK